MASQNTVTGTTLNNPTTATTNTLPNGSSTSTNNVISSSPSSTASMFTAMGPTSQSPLTEMNFSSSGSITPNPSSAPNQIAPSATNNIGVIAGGAAAGLGALLLAALVGAVAWVRRGKNKKSRDAEKGTALKEQKGFLESSSSPSSSPSGGDSPGHSTSSADDSPDKKKRGVGTGNYGSVQVQPNQYDGTEVPLRDPVVYGELRPTNPQQNQYDRVSGTETSQLGRPATSATPGYSSVRPANEKGSEVEYSGLDSTGTPVSAPAPKF
jgi:hypothetical protein